MTSAIVLISLVERIYQDRIIAGGQGKYQPNNSMTVGNLHSSEFLCFFEPTINCWWCLQDSGVFLCVIDDSNEHMLSVWDCNKGTKHAEVKVKYSQSNIRCK